ncbi:MAG TPA: hypothetical protein VFA57_04040 [Pseudolabrys sp.]|jgi:hypothetical protein|nr:hypothetical protein [Pseudolabrys sp.]
MAMRIGRQYYERQCTRARDATIARNIANFAASFATGMLEKVRRVSARWAWRVIGACPIAARARRTPEYLSDLKSETAGIAGRPTGNQN